MIWDTPVQVRGSTGPALARKVHWHWPGAGLHASQSGLARAAQHATERGWRSLFVCLFVCLRVWLPVACASFPRAARHAHRGALDTHTAVLRALTDAAVL